MRVLRERRELVELQLSVLCRWLRLAAREQSPRLRELCEVLPAADRAWFSKMAKSESAKAADRAWVLSSVTLGNAKAHTAKNALRPLVRNAPGLAPRQEDCPSGEALPVLHGVDTEDELAEVQMQIAEEAGP